MNGVDELPVHHSRSLAHRLTGVRSPFEDLYELVKNSDRTVTF